MIGQEGKAQPAESDSKACETDTSGLHQSLWCELIKLPNSAFSGVRAIVTNGLERQYAFEQDPEPTVWEVCCVCATGLLWKKIWYCARLYHNLCSYFLPCSLQLELCLSGSSPRALGRPHRRDTLLRPSSPRVGLLTTDHQEKRNVLPEK